MATKPLHKYTVAEAGNLQVYENYSSVTITVDDDDTDNNGTDWTTSGDGLANFGGCQSFTVSSGNADANGYGNFEHAPPTGYYAMFTKNLSEFG